MKKIIFAGTPEIAAGVLKTLIDANYEIICCLTQPDRPQGRGLKLTPSAVKTCALKHNIPVLQPKSLKNLDIQQQLIDLKPDLMIVMAYGLILPSAVLNIPKLGCINIHASILPRWRGAAPIQYSILSGDIKSGITIMQMDAGLDTGDILETYPCIIPNYYTSADLHDHLAQLAQTAILDLLPKILDKQVQPIKQDNNLATYAHKIDKQQARINWHQSATEIDRCIRAYNPWPVAFTTIDQQTVRIWKAEHIDTDMEGEPGTILATKKEGIVVATGKGAILILMLQFPGKKPLSAGIYCNANQYISIGKIFN